MLRRALMVRKAVARLLSVVKHTQGNIALYTIKRGVAVVTILKNPAPLAPALLGLILFGVAPKGSLGVTM